MEEIKKNNLIEDIAIEEEMESSFIDYSMSVIISRAIPDARDGLKPIHRRILYAMNELGLHHNTSFKKSAKVVGEVIAKYHPHGDQAAYESLVRMAQKFSLRYPLVNGQGNFGSIDGDSAAAMRYTEAKLQKITELLMQDIDKNTVDFIDNYDASEKEPVVLPNKLPNLLINGSTGIAVGMATSIPPHNIKEVINAAIFLAKQFIKGEETFIEDLFAFIKGPDFPTGGEILNPTEIKEAYKTGRGRAIIRSKAEIREANESSSKSKIIIREIPYMVNKSSLVKKIVEAAKNGRVNISNVSDESNREGIRIVIELKKNTDPNVELNKLFKHTPLQTSFSINLLALDGTFPKVLNLKEALNIFLNHQNEILIRKTNFLLKKSEARIHVLEGLKLALDNIDWTINTIKSSLNRSEAISKLQKGPKNFQNEQNSIGAKIDSIDFLTTKQAESILDMRLSKLTMLETKNLEIEIDKLILEINNYKELLASENLRYQNIIDDLEKISLDFGDERRTKISNIDILDMDDIDFVEQKDVAVILTETGYLKRISLDEYINQNRGGIGKKSIKTKDNDNVKQFVFSNTHSDLLFFTTKGKVYKLPTHTIIEPASKNTKGIPIVNYFKSDNGLIMDENEKVEVMIKMGNPLKDELVFVTKKGIIKKTKLSEFESINKNGKKAIKIDEDDEIFEVFSISENDSYNILIGASNGKVINFDGDQIRTMSRVTRGVKGIRLEKDHFVIGASSSLEGDKVLSISENGFGKLSNLDDFREIKRGGKGVIAINTSKAGDLKALEVVNGDEDVIIITDKGTTIRISLNQIKELNRNTKGIKIVTLRDGESISKVRVISNVDDVSNENEVSNENDISNENEISK